MKKILIGLALLASLSSFAKTYDVTKGDSVTIVTSKVSGSDEQSVIRSARVLNQKCLSRQLIGPQKHFFKSFYSSKDWIGIQVCKGVGFSARIDNESDRIVLMTVQVSGSEQKSSERAQNQLSEKCNELDGELIGNREHLYKNNRRAIYWIGAQICKY